MTWKLLISCLFKVRTCISERLTQLWKHSFYLYLAGLFSVFAVLDTTVLYYTSNIRQPAFDTMVRYRVVVPKPDPDIIIANNQRGQPRGDGAGLRMLAVAAPGTGQFVEQLEKQQPKAVVFDTLFSDADV